MREGSLTLNTMIIIVKYFSLIHGRKFNNLFSNIGNNNITGKLPYLSGLSELQHLLVDAGD